MGRNTGKFTEHKRAMELKISELINIEVKALSRVRILSIPWTIQSTGISRPDY